MKSFSTLRGNAALIELGMYRKLHLPLPPCPLVPHSPPLPLAFIAPEAFLPGVFSPPWLVAIER